MFTDLLKEADPSWPVHSNILNNRGITWLELHQRDQAVADFTLVIESSASNNESRACALNNRADIFDRENPSLAIADRTAVLALSATTYNRRFIALIRRARALRSVGDYSGALDDLETVVNLIDDIAIEQKMAARLQRAEWAIEAGESEEARPDLDAVLASYRNFKGVERRAHALQARLAASGGHDEDAHAS
jgi:tetratricopeptide (TPR) repeat protein